MVTLSSIQGFLGAVRGAKEIVFSTYVLQAHGEVFDALEAACKRGAHVVVRVEKEPYANPHGGVWNANAVDALRALGADAQVRTGSHFKGAVVDGVGFLDDCNWKQDGSDTILRDSTHDDIRMIRDAVEGRIDPATQSFATKKDDALAEEKALLVTAEPGEDVIVETETLSFGAVAAELNDLTKTKHCRVRLILNKQDLLKPGASHEIGTSKWLQKSGVEVHLSSATEKFAVVGTHAWIGSTNASIEDAALRKNHSGQPDTVDWGMECNSRAVIAHLDEHFEGRWNRGAASKIQEL